jgi:hypothetical protein
VPIKRVETSPALSIEKEQTDNENLQPLKEKLEDFMIQQKPYSFKKLTNTTPSECFHEGLGKE